MNSISIIRKLFVNNIPGFEDLSKQNEWIYLYTFSCIDWSYENTARTYDLEGQTNAESTQVRQQASFFVETAKQSITPPFDIHPGDYIGYEQGGVKFFWRIVKIQQFPIFNNCCTYQFITESLQPREADLSLVCGELKPLDEEDYNV